jgi:hypothetical protein
MVLSARTPLQDTTLYEFILVNTNFVLLTHNKCKWDSSRIAFSKCVIKNVISPLQWNVHPWVPCRLKKK